MGWNETKPQSPIKISIDKKQKSTQKPLTNQWFFAILIPAFTAEKRILMKRYLDDILLYTVDNDAESRLIYLIALCLGITTIRSAQPHGASLDNEHSAIDLIRASGKRQIWTVELPGERMENSLRASGYQVTTIDHHVYGTLDRAHDPDTGQRKASSLEQFLELLEVTSEEDRFYLTNKLRSCIFSLGNFAQWNTLIGIGIMDDRHIKGLREEGYTNEMMRQVFSLREDLNRQIDPQYDAKVKAAERIWDEHTTVGAYTLFKSDLPFGIAGSIAFLNARTNACTMAKDLEYNPMIISECGGKKLRVLNIGPEVVRKLNDAFHNKHRFTYGAGRYWGSGGDTHPTDITLEELLAVLT